MKAFRFEDRTIPEPLIIVAPSLDVALQEFRAEACANREALHDPHRVELLGEYVRVAQSDD